MNAPPASSSAGACPKCKAALEPDARFCGECGERLDPPRAAVTEEHEAASTSKTLYAPPRPQAKAPASAGTPAPISTKSPAASPWPPPVVAPAKPFATPSPVAAAAKPEATPPAPAAAKPLPAPLPAIPATVAPLAMPASYAKAKSVDRLIGRTLNHRYEVEKKIGEGGFGAVFKGKQLATGREVALKILHPQNVGDPTVVARFRREAEACSKLRDPHTVITYDFDETEDGVLYLAMELLQGKSLQQLERADGPMGADRVLGILDQVAQALGEAHGQGIVHRDMKPENVMIERRGEEDFVKVLDFGIAKIVGNASMKGPALTAVGQTVGTLEFMSPEQLRGKSLDGRSDIYALGMMAYEMLTGELPFKNAKSSTEVIEFHLQKPAPAPSQLRPDLNIPSYVDEIILKMVAKNPEDRHTDVAELRAHIAEGISSADTRASKKELVRVIAVVGGILALIGIIVAILSR